MMKRFISALVLFVMVSNIACGVANASGYTIYSTDGQKKHVKPDLKKEPKESASVATRFGIGGVAGLGIGSVFDVVSDAVKKKSMAVASVASAAASSAASSAVPAVVGTLSAAAVGGIASAVVVVAAALGFVSYKLYQKYRNRLLGVSSEAASKLYHFAQNKGIDYEALKQSYLRKRLDSICQANDFPNGVDMSRTQTEIRNTNLFSRWRGRFLTVFNEAGTSIKVPTVGGFPHVIVTKLVCKGKSDEILSSFLGETSRSTPFRPQLGEISQLQEKSVRHPFYYSYNPYGYSRIPFDAINTRLHPAAPLSIPGYGYGMPGYGTPHSASAIR